MARVIVLGAGAMGLAATYEVLRRGHQATLIEASDTPGGMAAHFDFGGLSLERFYHFVCKSDEPTFELLRELGIFSKLRWQRTSMGYFTGEKVHRWGDPLALLAFPHLNPLEKLRYGVLMFLSVRRDRWNSLENVSARTWIESWCGRSVYRKLWRQLFDLKFYEYADNISARWIWTRIHRLGRSRQSLMQEVLGYVEGGSQTLIDALVREVERLAGDLHLSEPCEQILVSNGKAVGVQTKKGRYDADAVISTVPTPLVSRLVPDLSPDERALYDQIQNIGVVCVVLKLRKPVTEHFWINIVDPSLPIPGIVEFSNLRQLGSNSVVYAPYYMPSTNPLWSRTDDVFINEVIDCLIKINPNICRDDLIMAQVGRLRHAQPICPPGFGARLPPVQTSVRGLQIADTCFYYPEDRGIAESVRLGREMARTAVAGTRSQ
jgi:protoporphyrinogen oxidase